MGIAQVDRVAILGASTMGRGIAQVVATAGYDVTIRDVDETVIHEAYDHVEWSLRQLHDNRQLAEEPSTILDRVHLSSDLSETVDRADLVVEAVPEDRSVKRDVFEALDDVAPADTVIGTTTSSLSVSELASRVEDPGRVVGLHFFDPPVKMDLVEVVQGEHTSESIAATAVSFVESLGKTPIRVRSDVRGFVVNSVLAAFVGEPAWMVSTHEATIREADAAMVHRRGYPMGPFELADTVGLDVLFRVLRANDDSIPPILAQKVDGDHVGRDAGRGFYVYDESSLSLTERRDRDRGRGTLGPDYERGDGHEFDWFRVEARMANVAARLVGDRATTPAAIDTGMRLGAGFPHGICQRADELGLDRILEALESHHDETGEGRYEPTSFLVELVDAGRTGVAAGAGFHEYDDDATPFDAGEVRDSTSSS